MPEVLSNQSASVALAAAITASSAAVTRATATNGWPGDSNGPATGNFRITVTDGTNYEIMLVTGGQGTTSLPVTRAVELISGVKTAFAFGTNATMTPVPTAEGIPAALASSTVSGPDAFGTTAIVGASAAYSRGDHDHGLPALPRLNYGTAVSFDGSTGYVNTPYDAPSVSALTLMVWIKVPSSFTQAYPRFVSTGSAYYTAGAEIGYNIAGPDVFGALLHSAGAIYGVTDTATLAGLAGQWVLYVLTYNAVDMLMYRDGNQVGSTALTTAVTASSQGFMVATDNAYVPALTNGLLAHAAYWSGTALTAAQVSALYGNASSMTEAQYESYVESLNPTVYFPMQEISGNTAINQGSTASADNGTYSGGYTLTDGIGPIPIHPVLLTYPAAPTAVTPVSGTAYQNANNYDVLLRIPVTYNPTGSAAATLAVGIGPTATPTQITEDSEPISGSAGVIRTKEIYLPSQWYALLTATNATIGTGTVTAV